MLTQIKSFLQIRQWDFEQLDDNTLASGFTSPLPDGQDHGFPFYILLIQDMFDDQYVRLAIVPYAEQPVGGYPQGLFSRLGQLNHNLPVAKFGIDADGDLELLIDIPARQLDASRFDVAVQLLADYAGLQYADVISRVAE